VVASLEFTNERRRARYDYIGRASHKATLAADRLHLAPGALALVSDVQAYAPVGVGIFAAKAVEEARLFYGFRGAFAAPEWVAI
jgi:hypothetical protein